MLLLEKRSLKLHALTLCAKSLGVMQAERVFHGKNEKEVAGGGKRNDSHVPRVFSSLKNTTNSGCEYESYRDRDGRMKDGFPESVQAILFSPHLLRPSLQWSRVINYATHRRFFSFTSFSFAVFLTGFTFCTGA